eukprot:1947040-Alexandrium_andersonii.AAC.1
MLEHYYLSRTRWRAAQPPPPMAGEDATEVGAVKGKAKGKGKKGKDGAGKAGDGKGKKGDGKNQEAG